MDREMIELYREPFRKVAAVAERLGFVLHDIDELHRVVAEFRRGRDGLVFGSDYRDVPCWGLAVVRNADDGWRAVPGEFPPGVNAPALVKGERRDYDVPNLARVHAAPVELGHYDLDGQLGWLEDHAEWAFGPEADYRIGYEEFVYEQTIAVTAGPARHWPSLQEWFWRKRWGWDAPVRFRLEGSRAFGGFRIVAIDADDLESFSDNDSLEEALSEARRRYGVAREQWVFLDSATRPR